MSHWRVSIIAGVAYGLGVGVGMNLLHDFAGGALILLLVLLATPRSDGAP